MEKNSFNCRRLISVVACLSVQLCVGIIYLWSVFSKPTQTQLLLSENLANLVSSVMIFGFVLGNLAGGFIQDKTNPRLVAAVGCAMFCVGILSTSFLTHACASLIFLTYSVVAGMGSGFTYSSILSCLQRWFPARRGFASGLSVAAFGMSTVVFSLVSTRLLDSLSIFDVFKILSGIFFVVCLIACSLIRLPHAQNGASLQKTGKTPLQAIKTAGFWCIFLTSFFINATWNILTPLIKPLLGEMGGDSTSVALIATMAVMLTGISNAGGRLGMASLSDILKRTNIMIAMASITVVCALLLSLAINLTQFWLFFVVVLFVAFAYGGPSAIMPAMSVDLFGTKYSGTNYGLILLSLGFSSVIFTAISNALRDSSGSYTISFIMCAVCALIPIALMLVYARLYNPKKLKADLIVEGDKVDEQQN